MMKREKDRGEKIRRMKRDGGRVVSGGRGVVANGGGGGVRIKGTRREQVKRKGYDR